MPEPRPIALPFHNGAPDAGMAAGVTAVVEALGLRPEVVPPVDPALPEVRRSIELDLRLADRVRAACALVDRVRERACVPA